MSYLKKVAKTSRPKHPRPNCPWPKRPLAKLSYISYRNRRMSLCVRGLFIVVIAECGNRCFRGDGLLLDSVLLTSVHILYTNSIILL